MAIKAPQRTKIEIEEDRRRRGVPDWRDASAYPRNDDALSDDQWRWEFIRRLKEYRAGWEQYCSWLESAPGRPTKTKQPIRPLEFGLTDWLDPGTHAAPEFYRAGASQVHFDEPTRQGRELHYLSLRSAETEGTLFFSIDPTEPFTPQQTLIQDAYDAARACSVDPGEKVRRPRRRNNRTPTMGRPRPFLLRLLDARNEGIPVKEILEHFSAEGLFGSHDINEASLRRSILYAERFWRSL
jgi:hypothetical protein